MKAFLHITLLGLVVTLCPAAEEGDTVRSFKKLTLTNEFWGEGAHFADFNHDGSNDIVCGPFIWWGPEFKEKGAYNTPPAAAYDPLKYSDYFLTYTHDLNGDGWADILVFSWPGKATTWYENPQGKTALWAAHTIFDETDNESPTLGDMTGDGRPELICHTGGRLGYGELDWNDPTKKATYHAITKPDIKAYFRYTHGYGFGDINGDGHPDILDKNGWREQPAKVEGDADWVFHATPFTPEGGRGGSQMLVYDVNGDGQNDVITSWDAHGYGLAWYEGKKVGNDITFTTHQLMGSTPEQSPHGVKFSQLHAMTLADIDGDGVQDLVTGKRFWAHGPDKDEEPGAPAVLYWFKIKRGKDGSVDFVPHQIDNDSGVGTQVTAGDVNKDGLQDVIVGNKKGVFVFLQQKGVLKK